MTFYFSASVNTLGLSNPSGGFEQPSRGTLNNTATKLNIAKMYNLLLITKRQNKMADW